MSFFEKKDQKAFVSWPAWRLHFVRAGLVLHKVRTRLCRRGQKFFGPFFQKGTACFLATVAQIPAALAPLKAKQRRSALPSTDEIAKDHGFSAEAVRVLQDAIRRGGGRMAQFSHKELGGMGQWSAGGMTQIGAMSDTRLRDRVGRLCAALAEAPAPVAEGAAAEGAVAEGAVAGRSDWWPDGLGSPSASGAQNGMRYACFPQARRVAVEQGGHVTVYDSGEHRIGGVSQSQGGGQELVFTSQLGRVRAQDLPVQG